MARTAKQIAAAVYVAPMTREGITPMDKPKFTAPHAHVLRVERAGQWLDYSSIRTEQDMRDAIRIVDEGPRGGYVIVDSPGMFHSQVVYQRND